MSVSLDLHEGFTPDTLGGMDTYTYPSGLTAGQAVTTPGGNPAVVLDPGKRPIKVGVADLVWIHVETAKHGFVTTASASDLKVAA